jgi:hypothetical protein
MKSGLQTTRVGQKNKIRRRWAKRGTRPTAPKDQRTASAYIFGAICPKDGKGAALVMPRCHTEAMNLHLGEIATQIAPGAHAALLVERHRRLLLRRLEQTRRSALADHVAPTTRLGLWVLIRESGY